MIITATDVTVTEQHQAQCGLCGWAGKLRTASGPAEHDRTGHIDWHRDYEAAMLRVAGYLATRSMQVLDTNWKHGGQHLAMVCWGRGSRALGAPQLVLIDLRVNKRHHGGPLETITNTRRRVMRGLGAAWLREHGRRSDTIRIDVIGVLGDPTDDGGYTIEHVREV
jgi:Holliday junction resolvase-like predicted endonuclease